MFFLAHNPRICHAEPSEAQVKHLQSNLSPLGDPSRRCGSLRMTAMGAE